jgi:NAD+ synthase (glutamine-hydrolysing)
LSQEIKLNKDLGYLRLGVAVPALRVANVGYNVRSIIELMQQARSEGVQILAFPEMALTGYTIGDLVQHETLLREAEQGLKYILAEGSGDNMVTVIGMPVSAEQKVYNCAVVINSGSISGVIAKTYLPNYKEYYDDRWYGSSKDISISTIDLAGQIVPFGMDILFRLKGISSAILGVEICEDLWVPFAPHEFQSAAGANILINLSASNEVLGKDDWRRIMVSSESGRCISAYGYVSSSIGESSNDMVFGGHAIIAENGTILKESPRLCIEKELIIQDIDIERITFDRRVMTSFWDAVRHTKPFRMIETDIHDFTPTRLYREIDPHPFVPSDPEHRADRCREVFSLQVGALSKKLTGAGKKNIVLGVSGGLDSTLALLAVVKTMDFLELPRTNVYAYTLPGFGTTRRTKNNAARLCEALGVSFEEINITRTCESQLRDLKHKGKEDVVFENVQARYRYAFLFNKANEVDGIMVGTGDLTEVALGWSTFAGDQISHYHINVSVPKTLVRYLIEWVADEELCHVPAEKILRDILSTPISPELLRPANGRISQKSEDIIGPIELADFFLYPFIRFGMRPGKILFLANEARRQGLFDGQYTLEDLNKWLQSFIKRFFANQFKRTCMPEGPKVGTVSLSPRGDWRMPSDADPGLWLEDLESMYKKLC